MPAKKGKLGAREELIVSGVLLILAIVGWFILIYKPVVARTNQLNDDISSMEDSISSIQKYKTQESTLRGHISRLQQEIDEWDDRFPPRNSIVSLAKQIVTYGESFNIKLTEIQPSLFDLYALERAGAQVSGAYVMQMPLKLRFQGRYLNTSKMIDQLNSLPFNVSVTDVDFNVIADKYPQVECSLNLYLYVHI